MTEQPQNSKFSLIDVGSSGGLHHRWQRFAPHIRNFGFEPNEEEFGKLSPSDDCVWINAGLAGVSGKREIHLTRTYQNSSLLKPNQALLETLEWGNDHDIVSSPAVDCLTLDDALAGHGVVADYLKIDTQGSELEILQGGLKSLATSVCVELEVEFVELYSGQPLFADVDTFMRQNGFFLCDLSNTLHVKQRGRTQLGGPKGRLISADALYFREHDIMAGHDSSPEMSSRGITAQVIAYIAYGLIDLAVALAEGDCARRINYKVPEFLATTYHKELTRRNVGNLYPFAFAISRAVKKLGRLITPSGSSLWSPELGNPRWRKG